MVEAVDGKGVRVITLTANTALFQREIPRLLKVSVAFVDFPLGAKQFTEQCIRLWIDWVAFYGRLQKIATFVPLARGQ